MNAIPQQREAMDDYRVLLTRYIPALAKLKAQGTATMVLADVVRWLLAYDKGTADANLWFELDTLASNTCMDACNLIHERHKQRWLAPLRSIPSFAEFITFVEARGLDAYIEVIMVLDKAEREEKRGAA